MSEEPEDTGSMIRALAADLITDSKAMDPVDCLRFYCNRLVDLHNEVSSTKLRLMRVLPVVDR